jgi:uncharacterized linocin/CFP29 family protein
MIDRNTGLGWTDAQWNQVRQAVADEWQRVRVAGSVLPTYGPLPASTAVVPTEVLRDGGTIDDSATARIVELYATVELSNQQVREDDLSDATLLFKRAAAALAREEDRIVFNGQHQPKTYSVAGIVEAPKEAPKTRFPCVKRERGEPRLDEAIQYELQQAAATLMHRGLSAVDVIRYDKAGSPLNTLAKTNPGALGLVFVANAVVDDIDLDGDTLVATTAEAIALLERNGYGSPFALIFSREPFVESHRPVRHSALALPSDRIEPLLGQQILRAAALDEGPQRTAKPFVGRGLLLSFAGGALDLAVATEATPQFVQVNDKGRYAFRVFERFALRVKDNNAVVRLEFLRTPPASSSSPSPSRAASAQSASASQAASSEGTRRRATSS